MSNYKKAIDKSGTNFKTADYQSNIDDKYKVNSSGVAGDNLQEPIPNFNSTPSEKVISNKNNAWIILGRDRPNSKLSGYGGKGDTQAASIDIVVGRMGSEVREVNSKNEQLWVDPDFKKDAARIYISQKTDVDKNFELVDGKVGNSKTKSAIALKADGIRLIAREGIKLVTGIDKKNSQGAELSSVSGIDLIAGNDDTDLQPIPKGKNLADALERMVHHVDKLCGIVDAFLMSQIELNQTITNHYHYSPYFAQPTTPGIDALVPKGIKVTIDQLTKVKRSLVAFKQNLAAFKFTYFNPAGKKYINSRNNNVN